MSNQEKFILLNIVIVNWNTGRYLKDCVDSVLRYESRNDIAITIVDNNSTDNSINDIEELDPRINLIRLKINLGFAKGCNIGARSVSSKFILFLNPDTKLLNNSISKSIYFFESLSDKSISILGIKNVDSSGKTIKTCAYFPTFLRMVCFVFGLTKIFPRYTSSFMIDFDHESNKIVDQVMGSYFLIKSEVFKEFNGFDERFFVYYEELDLSYRIHSKGLKSIFLSDEEIFHLGGVSSSQIKARSLFYSLRSKFLYVEKHFDNLKASLLFCVFFLIEPINRFFKLLIHLRITEIWKMFKSYIYFYKWFFKNKM